MENIPKIYTKINKKKYVIKKSTELEPKKSSKETKNAKTIRHTENR